MEPKIGIEAVNRQSIAEALSSVLADEFLLYVKTRNAHWNIEGPNFHHAHKFLETQFEQLDEIIDKVAERIRTIGHYAPGTLKEYLSLSHLSEMNRFPSSSLGFIKELLIDHEQIVIILRRDINRFVSDFGDQGSTDFIMALMQTHEKMAWMLRAHLM
jgi:starvation-inducible DNA-binding protein